MQQQPDQGNAAVQGGGGGQQASAGGQEGQQQGGQQGAAGQPQTIGLGDLGSMLAMGPDMMIQVLAMTIDAVGQGVEFSGDQLARLGELAQQLSDRVAALGGGGGGGGGGGTA